MIANLILYNITQIDDDDLDFPPDLNIDSLDYRKKSIEAIQKARKPELHVMGLRDSVLSRNYCFVEIKVLCARHFISRQPPVPPGENGGVEQQLKLICVSQFAASESKPGEHTAGANYQSQHKSLR